MSYELLVSVLSAMGFLLSVYAIHVEKRARKTKGKHKAVCDINEKISCTRVLTSKYSKTLGMSNTTYGIFFYALIFILSFFSMRYVFYLAVASGIVTIYLAYNLFYKLKDVCLVCTCIYAVNIAILIVSALDFF